MLIFKTETFKFSKKDQEGFSYLSYLMDRYEYGGGKIRRYTFDNYIQIEIDHIIETDEEKEYQDYKKDLTNFSDSDIL